MGSIAEIAADVILALGGNPASEAAMWAWASAQHYATVVCQNRAHVLVFVTEQVDFSVLEKACAGYHLYGGQAGQAPTYTGGQLCRALVVKYLNHWSYRRTELEVRSNSLVRWFVGYGLQEATLDHVTLWRFAAWVKQHVRRVFFDETLKQIDRALPAEPKRDQIGDTFALASRAQEQTRTVMLRHASKQVLRHLAAVTAAGHALVVAGLAPSGHPTALFGEKQERPEQYLEKAERAALELRTATAAHECLRLAVQQRQAVGVGKVVQQIEYKALVRWEEVLGKVLKDEFTITTDAAGRASAVSHPVQKAKGSYRRGSMVDLDATYRLHGEHSQLGYNANLAVSVNFIREINAMLGAAPDSTGVANLLAQQKAHLGIQPPKLIYDRAAGMPKIFADVARVSDGKTQLVAKLIGYSKRSARFGPSDFTVNALGQLVCPHGKLATKAYAAHTAAGLTYRFPAQLCQGCPLWDKCRGTEVKPNTFRQVFISDYVYCQRQALAYTKTAAFLVDMKLRPQVERIIAILTRYNGARRAVADGMANADFQLKMCAMAYNLKRWHKLTLAHQKAQRYHPPSADG